MLFGRRKYLKPAAARTAAPALERLEDRTVPALLGNSLFPADNPWNQQITNAPVAANSAAVINNIIGLYGNNRLHPDFGQDYHNAGDLYGIPYNVVHGNSVAKTHVVIDAYAGESDLQDAPIPANAVIEGDFQNGPQFGVNGRGDSHLIVYDVDNNVAYEFYRASRPNENSDGQWHADQESVWDMKTDKLRTLGWTSADAAGLAILPGLVRPDEGLPVSQGGEGVINHAIRFTLQNNIILNQYLYPASHTANPGNTNPAVQPPMGARFRLKASVDISQLNSESRVIAQAMNDYGLIVADNGSNFFFSGASYSVDASNGFALTWNDNDIQDSTHGLKSLTFSDFEVVDLTPAVTALSAASGPTGSSVTVTGRNFSGAAGHLQVFFGNTPASSVTILDDGHLTAVVPAGTGTADVRVQSGVSAPSNLSNINDPIFGYGISAASAADRFTIANGPTVVSILPVGGSPRTTPVNSMTITFSRAVTGFTLANLRLTTGGGANLLTGSQTLTTSDNVTWTLGNLAGLTDPTHRVAAFTLTLLPAGITDLSGTPLAVGAAGSFVVYDPALALSGTTLALAGTGGNDTFVFVAGAADQATLNGIVYAIDPSAVTAVQFVGNGGSDVATLSGGVGPRLLVLTPTGGTLTQPGLTLSLVGVATVYSYGAATDTASLFDSPGSDLFAATPTFSYLSGGGFLDVAIGYHNVYATSSHGGSDTAYFYDSPGNDTFVGTSGYSYLSGTGFVNDAIGFKAVSAYATAGGSDTAYLYDAPGSNNFVATPTYAYLAGSSSFNYVSGFKAVYAYATAGASDAAYLYDGAGANTFVGTSTYSYLTGSGYLNFAVGFKVVTAYATGAGSDVAYLFDSPGNDLFAGSGTAATMYTPYEQYGAYGFAAVDIFSTQGGYDQALLSGLLYALGEIGPWH
jgi:hypothetical protein